MDIPRGYLMGATTRFVLLAVMTVLALASIAALADDVEGSTYDVDLEFTDPSNVRAAQGSNPIRFNYTVTHNGSAFSEEVYIDLEGVPPFWQVFFSADPETGVTVGTYMPHDPFDFLLVRNETCHLTIVVTPAPNQLNKTYWFNVNAFPRLNTTNNETHTFGIIGQIYELEVRTDLGYLTTEPGDLVQYTIRTKNLGNGEDTVVFDLEGVPLSWLWYINPPSLAISSDERETVNVTIVVPSRFEEAPIGSYHFYFTATSENGNVSAPLEIVLEVLQVYRVEWMLLDEAITNPDRPIVPNDTLRPMRSFNPYETETIEVTLMIQNFGNGNDNVSMSAESLTSGVDVGVTPESMFLLRSRSQFIRVSISVSPETAPGTYRIFVNAASEDPEVAVRVVPVEFQVENFDASIPAVPTYVDPVDGLVIIPTIEIAPGTEMLFEIIVNNLGSRAIPAVYIRGFDDFIEDGVPTRWNFYNLSTPPIEAGDSYRIWAGPDGESEERIAWLSHSSGDHVLEFLLFYDFQSDETNDRCSVNITLNQRPEVTVTTSLLEMKAGEKLTIEGTVSDDMSNILWVSYRINDGEWIKANGTSKWSFVIEDQDLSKGKHTLEVKAYDGISESIISNLTFTVKGKTGDNSAPGPSLPIIVLCITTVGILGTLIRKGRRR